MAKKEDDKPDTHEQQKDKEAKILNEYSKNRGVVETVGKVRIKNLQDLALYYTPGVATASSAIRADKFLSYKYTGRGNRIAIISNATRILGLGNIGPEAGLPVIEGKALLFKRFGNVDAIPLSIDAGSVDEVVQFAKAISPCVGGINLEDISTPDCFTIYDKLQSLDIPVFHDDRQGTAVVADAALRNAMKLADKDIKKAKIVINGIGAAGIGIAELLIAAGSQHIVMCDTTGALYKGRKSNMNHIKEKIANHTNPQGLKGQFQDVVKGADVLIGVSTAGAFKEFHIKSMADKPIVFALANPVPEIRHFAAREAGVFVIATGESDVPNQVNNLLAFPGIFRGVLDVQARKINSAMLLEASRQLSHGVSVKKRTPEHIIPNFVEDDIVSTIANIAAGVAETAVKTGVAMIKVSPDEVRNNVKEALKRYSKIEKMMSRLGKKHTPFHHLFKKG